MRIIVNKLIGIDGKGGDAQVLFHNRSGEIIHTEGFEGYMTGENGGYIRKVSIPDVEFGYTTALFSGVFEFVVAP